MNWRGADHKFKTLIWMEVVCSFFIIPDMGIGYVVITDQAICFLICYWSDKFFETN